MLTMPCSCSHHCTLLSTRYQMTKMDHSAALSCNSILLIRVQATMCASPVTLTWSDPWSPLWSNSKASPSLSLLHLIGLHVLLKCVKMFLPQDLTFSVSPPWHTHDGLPPSLHVSAQMFPCQWGLSNPSHWSPMRNSDDFRTYHLPYHLSAPFFCTALIIIWHAKFYPCLYIVCPSSL